MEHVVYNDRFIKNIRTITAIVLIGALSMGGAYWILSRAIRNLAVAQLEASTIDWARIMGRQESGGNMKGAALSPTGPIAGVTIYDASGAPLFEDGLADIAPSGTKAPSGAEPAIAAVMKSRIPLFEPVPGDKAHAFMATYVPLVSNAGVRSVIKVVSDVDKARRILGGAFLTTAIELAMLIGCAFGVPAFAFFWRTRQKQVREDQIMFMAGHDAETGLLNRATFTDMLETIILDRAFANETIALHMVEIDRFKSVTDAFGQTTGDSLLKAFANRLQAAVRNEDIVSRFGNEQFLIAQCPSKSSSDAETFALTIQRRIAEPFIFDQQRVSVTASVGVAVAGSNGGSAPRLIKAAGTAAAHAKAHGVGSLKMFTPAMDEEAQKRSHIEKHLLDALRNDGFVLNFQPIFAAQDNKLLGFEALLRLPTKTGAQIPPATFIPVAEEMGLISRIGAWVLRRACTIAATWPNDLGVAVNLSPKQFDESDICAVVSQILAETGLDPKRLELEITEGLLLNDVDRIIEQLKALKAIGVSIAMDDFGTGYSSLSYLWRFPFDKLKIDRSFMPVLSDNDSNVVNILKTIVSLGRTLNLQVTAEGIETQNQADILTKLNCDQFQGYHFGRPMSEADVAITILRCSIEAGMRDIADAAAVRTAA